MYSTIEELQALPKEKKQELVELFIEHYHSHNEEEKEQAWKIAQDLYSIYEPMIKEILINPRRGLRKFNIHNDMWANTVDKEGFEDMLQEGRTQFYEALCDYDPSSEVYFSHYIEKKLGYGIFNYLRNGQKFDDMLQSTESFDVLFAEGTDCTAPFNALKHEGIYVLGIETDLFDENTLTNKDLALRVAWNSLSDKQRNVLELVINRDYTLREAGYELGLHFTTVREIRNTALEKMKKVLKKFYETA